jgi:hypothetical protein
MAFWQWIAITLYVLVVALGNYLLLTQGDSK